MTLPRTYEVEQRGKKFATVLRVDGYWVGTLLSKRRALAVAKGEKHVADLDDGPVARWSPYWASLPLHTDKRSR